ncbi:hypothetical protein TDB9533_01074 [Thalassocella blandensis]|nr:hypothetical protein TDB9533_01074 [Thalassocella blandensis]
MRSTVKGFVKCSACSVLFLSGLQADVSFAHEFSIEEMTVFGRQQNLIGAANSASQGSISQAELSLRPLLRTGEILESVPGMVATQHSGSGKANQYNLRGFNLDHGTDFAAYVDYVPVNMPSHGHGQGYTDLNFVIPELVGEINYKKGSYYADIGDFSGVGSAQIFSANQLLDNRVQLSLGENEYQRLLAIGQLDAATSKFIYGLEAQTYSGPWDDVDEDVEKINLWLKQQWQIEHSDLISLSLMLYDNQWNSADQIPARAVEQNIISPYGSIDPSLGGESHRYNLSARWRKKISDHQTFDASVYAVDYGLNLWSNFTYFTSTDGDQFEQVDHRKYYGWDVRYGVKSTFSGLDISNVFGTHARVDDISELGLYDASQRERTGVTRSDEVTQSNTSAFWENTVHWNEQWRSVLNLRYDYYQFDVTPRDAREPSTMSVNGGKVNDDLVTASATVAYTLNTAAETYLSVGQGFHSNDARGVTLTQDPNTGEISDAADPLVDTMGYEWGLRLFTSEKLNASLAWWHLDIDSELLFVGDEGTTEDTGVGSVRKGFEFTAYYYVNEFWTLDFEYATTQAEFDTAVEGTREIPGAIDEVFTSGVNFNWYDRWSAQLRLRHVGDYPLAISPDSGQLMKADGSTLLNLRLRYAFNDQFNVSLDALNVTDSDDRDVEYFYASQLAGEAAPVDDRHYHIVEPRTVRLYFEFRY